MKKKPYQMPQVEVVKVQQMQMLCSSQGSTDSMYEEELDPSSFEEQY